MKGISRMLVVLEQAWQEITFAGILRIPFPRSIVRRSAPSALRRENPTAA